MIRSDICGKKRERPQTKEGKGSPGINLPTLGDIYEMDIRVEWVVDKLFPKQSVIVLHGKGGVGKTWLMLQIGPCVADDRLFLGLITMSVPVYCIDFENSLPTLHDRARVLGKRSFKVWYISNPNPPPLLDSIDWGQQGHREIPVNKLIRARAPRGKDRP